MAIAKGPKLVSTTGFPPSRKIETNLKSHTVTKSMNQVISRKLRPKNPGLKTALTISAGLAPLVFAGRKHTL